MLIVRLLLVLVALLLILSVAMYGFTRDTRYYRFAWQTLRVSALLCAVFGLLFVLERYVLVGWRVLL